MNQMLKTFAAVSALCVAGRASAADLIVNEWNGVGPSKTLEDGECDPAFSSCPPVDVGNGGDWVELVITGDYPDLNGYKLNWRNDDSPNKSGTLTLTSNALWDAALPAGTIITIREDIGVSTDTSFSASCNGSDEWVGDFHIEIDASDTTYITQSGNNLFQTDNDGWEMEIRDASNNVVQAWVGESGTGCTFCTGSGINSQEVGKLEEDPSSNPSTSGYNDGNCSSYGAPNCWTTDSVDYLQCFHALACGGSC